MAAGITVAVNDKALASLINSMSGWGAIGDRPDTGDVIAGSFYYATAPTNVLYQEQNGAWVAVLQTKTLNPANEIVAAGYYAATTLSAIDADLAVANIKSGVTIFGFAGTYAFTVTEHGFTQTYMPTAYDVWENVVTCVVPATATQVIIYGTQHAEDTANHADYQLQGLYNAVQKWYDEVDALRDHSVGKWVGAGTGGAHTAQVQIKTVGAAAVRIKHRGSGVIYGVG